MQTLARFGVASDKISGYFGQAGELVDIDDNDVEAPFGGRPFARAVFRVYDIT
jgi:hypothetical protein